MENPSPKFAKPKILCIDMEDSTSEELLSLGLNVSKGTFGQPYTVALSSTMTQHIAEAHLPLYSEQEIILVDLQKEATESPIGETSTPEDQSDYWISQSSGLIDPRFRAATEVTRDFNRILNTGGVFIVFASPKHRQIIQIGKKNHRYEPEQDVKASVWDFLSSLKELNVQESYGVEMKVDSDSNLGRLIESFLPDSEYTCVIDRPFRRDHPWYPLVLNKFDQTVAAAHTNERKGLLIVLPQLQNKTGFVKKLITEILPELAPHLFPDHTNGKWTEDKLYELPSVQRLKDQMQETIAKHNANLLELESKIKHHREAEGWMHALITETGDPLVAAVKSALETIGFRDVQDMDQIWDATDPKNRKEDLRINGNNLTLVIDVKGISGFPTDEDCRQAEKHATMLMREERRTNVNGLSIINHQRNIPPLIRENKIPFRKEIINYALESQLGLLTSWDLYRLVRNFIENQWTHENVKPLLYHHGRIKPIPFHYEYIGVIFKAYTDKFGIIIEDGKISKNERFAIEFDILYEEQAATTIMIDNVEVTSATVGDRTGLPWQSGSKIREGQKVYRIRPPESQ